MPGVPGSTILDAEHWLLPRGADAVAGRHDLKHVASSRETTLLTASSPVTHDSSSSQKLLDGTSDVPAV